MRWLRFFRRRQWDDERAREIESYLDHEIADNLARGMSVSEARAAAHRKLGNPTSIREEIYRMNSLGFIETLWKDVRYALRGLRKSPSFTVVALLSLALGIGATTAMFSVIYNVVISPYPYARPAEIWAPDVRDPKNPDNERTWYRLREYAEIKNLPAFAETMTTIPDTHVLTGDGHNPEQFQAVSVTASAFPFLGVAPILGRYLQPSDLRPDGQPEPVIVLSTGAWIRLFDSSPNALGKKLILDDQPYTVIGVMPPRFGWYTNEGGWIVLPEDSRGGRYSAVITRLKPGVSPQAAQQQLQALFTRLAAEHPEDFPKTGFTTRLNNYMNMTVASGEMESSLRLLLGAVGFLLLIACANVANLQLARATARAHEISVRMAVGARRGRLLRQLLTESLVLSVTGGLLGVLLAVALTKAVVALMPDFYVPNEARITVNTYVLLFSAGVSVLTGILFGLAPAIQSSRPHLVDALKDAGRTAGGGAGGRTRSTLVVAEVALSVVLLMGASLTIRGFLDLQKMDLGFQPERVLMFYLQMSPKRFVTYEQRTALATNVADAVRSIPGVQSVAIGNGGMPYGGPQTTYSIEGQPKADSRQLSIGLVSGGYGETLGIPLRAGRDFNAQEVARAEPVALINQTAAKLWPAGASPIGAHLHLDALEKPNDDAPSAPTANATVTVVGVIGDTRNDGRRSPTRASVYLPYTLLAPSWRVLAIRTHTPPMSLVNAVRERVSSVDKDQPLGRPITLEDLLGQETVQPRFNMALLSFFGFLGLALAAIGIYSTLSYTVARRTHEIGIRMALGACRGDVVHLMVTMAGRLVLVGLGLGLAGSLVLGRILRSEVLKSPEADPLALAAVVLVLTFAAFLACVVPARRAARLDPMSALRHE